MANKEISSLPQTDTVFDNDLLVLRQAGDAKRITGGDLRNQLLGDISRFAIKGKVSSTAQLPADAEIGDAYGVGTASPYGLYIYNGATWDNYGPIATLFTVENETLILSLGISSDVVSSVNGQTGAVELDAEDVSALPDTTEIPPDYTENVATDSEVQEVINEYSD